MCPPKGDGNHSIVRLTGFSMFDHYKILIHIALVFYADVYANPYFYKRNRT